jgi:hypothetical protein
MPNKANQTEWKIIGLSMGLCHALFYRNFSLFFVIPSKARNLTSWDMNVAPRFLALLEMTR